MSIGQLDECRYSTTFSSSKCVISNNHGDTIGQVPFSSHQVYKVINDGPELTCMAEDTVTWTELHCCMGHISPGVAKQLVEKGLVTAHQHILRPCCLL